MTTYFVGEPAAVAFKRLESQYRTTLPAGEFAVVRVDGRGFSRYTAGLDKPFDPVFAADMQATALFLAEQVEGAVLAYVQSDEISVVRAPGGDLWFGGQVQKIASVTAALATAGFNQLRPGGGLAVFDGRTHHLGGPDALGAYLCWRQDDAIKNSGSMLASHYFPHRQLLGKSVRARKEMLLAEDGIDWDGLDAHLRQGRLVARALRREQVTYRHSRTGQEHTVYADRRPWEARPAPLFGTGPAVLEGFTWPQGA